MGESLRLIELVGVDDTMDDPCVELRLRDAELPEGADLADLDRAEPLGIVDPGITFDFSRPVSFDDAACIRGGRVFAELQDAVVPFGTGGPEIQIERHRFSAHVEMDGAGLATLEGGVEGGSVDTAMLDAIVAPTLGDTPLSDIVRPDLDPDESNRCHSTSFVFTFDAVAAELRAAL